MKRLVVPALQLLGLAVVAFVLGEGLWWSLWMNHGWPAPPNILAWLLGADGEAAYGAQGDQMAVLVFVILGATWFARRKLHVKQPKEGADV
jgi:hypothetical protein